MAMTDNQAPSPHDNQYVLPQMVLLIYSPISIVSNNTTLRYDS